MSISVVFRSMLGKEDGKEIGKDEDISLKLGFPEDQPPVLLSKFGADGDAKMMLANQEVGSFPGYYQPEPSHGRCSYCDCPNIHVGLSFFPTEHLCVEGDLHNLTENDVAIIVAADETGDGNCIIARYLRTGE